jgi:sugar lactone lactonase YvrE
MYFIDTPTHEICAYPFDPGTGSIGRPSCVARIDQADGHPDGMCTDDDGCLWVALFGGGCVRRYTPEGALDTVVRLPVTYTTSCCFGGPARDRLFITTARRDLDEEGRRREPLAGSVWVVGPGVSGPPATPWAG